MFREALSRGGSISNDLVTAFDIETRRNLPYESEEETLVAIMDDGQRRDIVWLSPIPLQDPERRSSELPPGEPPEEEIEDV